ncbi:MAG: signal peptidase II [Planctomycetaceae bacterium]|nr:signal peptidase II [Planctomycetaceae bacterium]
MSSAQQRPQPQADSQNRAKIAPAIKSPLAVIVFMLVAAAGLAGDLWSKHYIFHRLLDEPNLAANANRLYSRLSLEHRDLPQQEIAKDTLDMLSPHTRTVAGVRLTLSTNPGVVFGLPMPRVMVAVVTVLTAGLVFYFFAASDRRAWWTQVAMALLLAGALGNLYDRLFSCVAIPGSFVPPVRYHVRDFIDCGQLGYPYVFNIADALLVAGVAMLILHWLATARRESKTAKKKS